MPSALANEGRKLCIKLPPNEKADSANGGNRQGSGVRFCTLHRLKKRTFETFTRTLATLRIKPPLMLRAVLFKF